MDTKLKEGIDKLERSGYLPHFSGMAKAMCAPFWWSSQSSNQPPEIRGIGTICFVNTGSGHLGITADHVFEEYLHDKSHSENVECQLGGSSFVPEKYVIDRSSDDEFDLATFSVSEVFVSSSLGHYHHNALKWPPDPIEQSDVVLYGGYPQNLTNSRVREVDFSFEYFISRVSVVAPTKIELDPNIENLYWPGHRGEVINREWRGISGGPLYRVIDGVAGKGTFDRFEVVGIIFKRRSDVILARPSELIDKNGSIKRPV